MDGTRMLQCSIFAAMAVAGCGGGTVSPWPATFLIGTATAPYQVEGGLHDSDWYQWESTSANTQMAHADNGPDEYDHFDADFALAEQMENSALRMGIDWSRLFPTAASFPSAPDPTALAHYHAVFASLKAHHLSPLVTLYHWNFPIWIDDLTQKDTVSGWLDAKSVQQLADFATFAGHEFGGEVDSWITLNEPTATLLQGFVLGTYPPERAGLANAAGIANAELATRNMIYAHAAAYDALHAADTVDADGDGVAVRVSEAFHLRTFAPSDPTSADDQTATAQLHYLSNELFVNAATRGDLDYDLDGKLDGPRDKSADPQLRGRLDFVGVNYYGPTLVAALPIAFGPLSGLPQLIDLPDGRPHTEYGWSIDAPGLRSVLDEVKGFGLPLWITENGIADHVDAQRPRFIAQHLQVVQQAISDGLKVEAYFHWSLIDNFEWAGGYCPCFGLARVDYAAAQKTRTLGAGAAVFQQIAHDRGVSPAILTQYPSYPPPTKECPGGG